jgi:hypothetical protein
MTTVKQRLSRKSGGIYALDRLESAVTGQKEFPD